MRLISVMTIGLLLIVCQGCGSPNAGDEVDVSEPDGVHMPPANSFAYNQRKYLVRISK